MLSKLGGGISGSSKKDSSTTSPKYQSLAGGTDGGTSGITAVIGGRGDAKGEMGIASMDAQSSCLKLYQFVDSAPYTHLRAQLQALNPAEVIVPETFEKGNNMIAVVEFIEKSFPNIEITFVYSGRLFNDEEGAKLVTHLSSTESNITPDVLNKHNCIAAAVALVGYVECMKKAEFPQGSLKVVYGAVEKPIVTEKRFDDTAIVTSGMSAITSGMSTITSGISTTYYRYPWLTLKGHVDDGSFLPKEGDALFTRNTGYCASEERVKSLNYSLPSKSGDARFQFKEDFMEVSNVPYVDVHCHLDLMCSARPFYRVPQFLHPFTDAIPFNFRGFISVFCDPATYCPSAYPRNPKLNRWFKGVLQDRTVLGATYGVHPHLVERMNDSVEHFIEEIFTEEKRDLFRAVAVGECGFDLQLNDEQKLNAQRDVFERQLRIAKRAEVPVDIHSRGRGNLAGVVERHTIASAKKELGRFSGIHRHCFTEGPEVAEMWMREFPFVYFGFTPRICKMSPNSHMAQSAIKLPLDRILLETDAPYFQPPQYANHPAMQRNFNIPPAALTVGIRIAELKGVPLDVVLEAALANSKRLYGISVWPDG